MALRAIYSGLHYLLVPGLVAYLAWRGLRNRGYWSRWGERFGFVRPPAGRSTVWVHAVSVGEVQAAVPLVRALKTRHPELGVLVTTTTPTGAEQVTRALGREAEHRYVPYDLPGAVGRFLDRVDPVLAVILETEFWPNMLHACARRSVPVVAANVRLSARSAAGYRRIGALTREMLAHVRVIAAQTAADAERIAALGAPPERIHVTGSVKFDVRLPASLREEAQALRRLWGVDRGVWIAASTEEGEDELILDAHRRVLERFGDALLVLVPRHPERFAKVAALCRRRGYRTARRTEKPCSCAEVEVFVGDTMGELPIFYAASDLAFVGGSLVPSGGHNMLEPAALGVPVILGPHVFNFADIARNLRASGAAVEVADGGGLAEVICRYLSDANLRHAAGEHGRAFVAANRGALERVLALVEGALEASPATGETKAARR